MKFDNDTFAIRSLGEALVTLRDSSDGIVEIISQTAEDTE
jgi:gamma-glutamyl-gamma-aminobutyrate hydrolase PuuD